MWTNIMGEKNSYW